jgi:hypothetical protein
MIHTLQRTEEHEARLYCMSLGLDPDLPVWGSDHRRFGLGRYLLPRWRWYVGVSEAALKRRI